MPGHNQLSAKGGNHGAVIGAQTQGWDSKLNAIFGTSLCCQFTKPRVCNYAAAKQEPRNLLVDAGGNRFRNKHISNCLAKRSRHISDVDFFLIGLS